MGGGFMRLENLYENFGKASPADQLKYIGEYRLRRAEDMAKPPTWPKVKLTKTGKVKSGKPRAKPLSEEEKTLMDLLGLKKKDVVALRALSPEEDE